MKKTIYKVFSFLTKMLFVWLIIDLIRAILGKVEWKFVGIELIVLVILWQITERLFSRFGDNNVLE